jgi:hypothetical protein
MEDKEYHMKKIIFFLMLVFLTVSVFAKERWEGDRQIAVTMNPGPLILGQILGGFGINAGFELAPVEWASLKANIYYIGFDPLKLIGEPIDYDGEGMMQKITSNVSLLRVNLEGRWYLSGNYVSGWFLNGGLQFHQLSASSSFPLGDVTLDDTTVGKGKVGIYITTWGICIGGGYKAIFGKNRAGFVFEPVMDLTIPIYSDIPFGNMGFEGDIIGWLLGIKGLRGGLMFGVAF